MRMTPLRLRLRQRERRPQRQRGSALTEFAIAMPLIIALVYGSMYLSDAGILKLRAQEIARYTAWALATRPLSDFEEQDHSELVAAAREEVEQELAELYPDLDAARSGPPLGHGRMTALGVFEPRAADVNLREVSMVPGQIDTQWSQPLGTLGVILGALNVGTGLGELMEAPFRALRFNLRGEARGRANLVVLPPIRPVDLARSDRLARQGRPFGADLGAFSHRGRRIRDLGPEGPRDIETVLIADPWRLADGATSKPNREERFGQGGLHSQVSLMADRALEALPFGPIAGMASALDVGRFPALGALFDPNPLAPAPVVISRPLANRNRSRPSLTGAGTVGQANAFTHFEAEEGLWEMGAVTNFETNPLYENADRTGSYLDALQMRGSGFMGCPREQQLRCRYR